MSEVVEAARRNRVNFLILALCVILGAAGVGKTADHHFGGWEEPSP